MFLFGKQDDGMNIIERLQFHLLDFRLMMSLSISQFARKAGLNKEEIELLEHGQIDMSKETALGIVGVLVAKGNNETKTLVQELFQVDRTIDLLMMIVDEKAS